MQAYEEAEKVVNGLVDGSVNILPFLQAGEVRSNKLFLRYQSKRQHWTPPKAVLCTVSPGVYQLLVAL